MEKKLSESSRPGKQTRVSAGTTLNKLLNKPPTKRQKAALEGAAERQERRDASQIDYSDIAALSDKQLAQFRRPRKKLVAVRLDADVLEWLQRYGAGYSTRIKYRFTGRHVAAAVISGAR
jgi:uncharacterized protein (DUF4415 family)